jgi:hypothetical protein
MDLLANVWQAMEGIGTVVGAVLTVGVAALAGAASAHRTNKKLERDRDQEHEAMRIRLSLLESHVEHQSRRCDERLAEEKTEQREYREWREKVWRVISRMAGELGIRL